MTKNASNRIKPRMAGVDARTGRERGKQAIEDELYMLRLLLDVAREGGYENMERRYRQDIEEVECELERARWR